MVCYATTVHFNAASVICLTIFFHLFQLDLLQHFQFQLIWISVLQSQVIPSGPQETLTTHPPPILITVNPSFLFTTISHSNSEQQISCFRHKVKNLISLLFFVSIVIWNPNAFLLALPFPNLINNHSFFSLCFVVRCLPPYPPSLSSLLPTAHFHVQEGIPTLASLQWMRSGIT